MQDTTQHVFILKGDAPEDLWNSRAGLQGPFVQGSGGALGQVLPWPINPADLEALYDTCAEHSRAIRVKAEGAFGGGLGGDAAATAEKLCDYGSASLFVDLGLDLETYGNAFLYLLQDKRGKLLKLERRPARTMFRTPDGGYLQIIRDERNQEIRTPYTAEEIIHVRVACPAARWYALPVWIGCADMLQLVKAATRYNKTFFKNNAVPDSALFISGANLNEPQKKDLQSYMQREFKGIENAHRMLLLSFSDPQVKVDLKPLGQPKDAEFVNLLDAARDRIPIAHGVPPRMLGIVAAGQLGGGGEVTGQFHAFEELTLKPLRRRMLDQCRPLWQKLNIPLDQIHFQGLDLTPPDVIQPPIGDLAQAVAAGILSVEEARQVLQYSLDATPAQATKSAEPSLDGLIALWKSL